MKSNKYIVFTAMGLELVGLILGSLYVGQLLDKKFQSQGLIMVGLSLASLAGWLFHIVVLAKSLEKNAKPGENGENTED